MLIAFVRHGSKEAIKGTHDKDLPLSAHGRVEAQRMRELLDAAGLKPNRCFSSRNVHAVETARALLGDSMNAPPVAELECLTPHARTDGIEAFVTEARTASLPADAVVLIVGNEPRLSQLLQSITGQPALPLPRGCLISVLVPAGRDIRGGGMITGQWQTGSAQLPDLTGKLGSKMQVSGVLAGLTITVAAVLLEGREPTFLQSIAVGLLTAGAAFFVAALYAYDRLMMPEAFWDAASKGSIRWWSKSQFEADRVAKGVVYAEMVWVWKWVFSPALFFASLGYLAMLADLEVRRPPAFCASVPVVVCHRAPVLLGLVVAILVAVYYLAFRPRLAVD